MSRCLLALTVSAALLGADAQPNRLLGAASPASGSLLEALRLPTEAARCRRAAEQGDVEAQARLGAMYYLGEGVPRDCREALKWLQRAAEQGEPHAQGCLGLMCAEGDGVPRDSVQAYAWLLRAKEGGDPQASEALLVVGRSLSRSQIEAAKRRAAETLGRRSGN